MYVIYIVLLNIGIHMTLTKKHRIQEDCDLLIDFMGKLLTSKRNSYHSPELFEHIFNLNLTRITDAKIPLNVYLMNFKLTRIIVSAQTGYNNLDSALDLIGYALLEYTKNIETNEHSFEKKLEVTLITLKHFRSQLLFNISNFYDKVNPIDIHTEFTKAVLDNLEKKETLNIILHTMVYLSLTRGVNLNEELKSYN